jgi:hypothetical protein
VRDAPFTAAVRLRFPVSVDRSNQGSEGGSLP